MCNPHVSRIAPGGIPDVMIIANPIRLFTGSGWKYWRNGTRRKMRSRGVSAYIR